jgi:hypothetical protein
MMNKQIIILLSLVLLAYLTACKTQKQVKQVEPKPEQVFDTPTSPLMLTILTRFGVSFIMGQSLKIGN